MWYPEYINTRNLDTLREYGANAIRIAMYTDQDKGYVYNKKESMKSLLQSIEAYQNYLTTRKKMEDI